MLLEALGQWLVLACTGPLVHGWQWAMAVESAAAARSAQLAAGGAVAVLVALAIDRLWGEPPARWHPVVAMGHVLGIIGKKIAPAADVPKDWVRFVSGMLGWWAAAAMVFAVYVLLHGALQPLPWWLGAVCAGVLLKPLLAWRMLQGEVLAVEHALAQSLPAGRERLSWLVSRDTAQLDAATVRESAIETLAENLCDSVIAPLFWFALAGLPGAAVYRLANTADAMWGYPGWRGQGAERRHWQWAGKWAARADDVLNWMPARITAAWLVLLGACAQPNRITHTFNWRGLLRDARVTPSPNGGWPMGAMSRVLGVRLSKPGVYQLNPTGRAPHAADMHRAVQCAGRVVAAHAVCALALLVGAIGWGWWHG